LARVRRLLPEPGRPRFRPQHDRHTIVQLGAQLVVIGLPDLGVD
jgi:hypothetical protein